MNIDLTKIIYPLITAVIGFFLRDLYGYIRNKIVKKEKPKLFVDYSYRWYSASGQNPRKYTFKSNLIIHNIDTVPIYDVKIYKYINNELSEIYLSKVALRPDEKVEKSEEQIIEYGVGYDDKEEVANLLPKIFTNPTIRVNYKDKNGKVFKIYWNKN